MRIQGCAREVQVPPPRAPAAVTRAYGIIVVQRCVAKPNCLFIIIMSAPGQSKRTGKRLSIFAAAVCGHSSLDSQARASDHRSSGLSNSFVGLLEAHPGQFQA